MLNLTRLTINSNARIQSNPFIRFFFSDFAVRQVRGDYLLLLQDKAGQLQYMREVETSDGKQGIVLKIQQPSNAYIALYEPLKAKSLSSVTLKNINIPWQKSVQDIAKVILAGSNPAIFNINGSKCYQRSEKVERQVVPNRKLHSFSPLLELCYDLKYGDMIQFSGCLGSRKTTTALNIASIFAKNQSHTSIFVNTVSVSESKRAVDETGSWALEAGSGKNQTDAGVYMLAVKAIYLGEMLMKAGQEVLLTVDGIRHVLQAEWHMVQLLSNPVNRLPGQLAFRSPRLPPIAVLNQIYANCMDNCVRNSKGSFSAIVTTDNRSGDELTPQITPYSNNLKHLNSLAKTVTFPLTLKHAPVGKVTQDGNDDLPSIEKCVGDLRKKINEYLAEKRDTELKRRLYKSDLTDAPWDYYKILDGEWWMNGLQNCKINSLQQLQQFLSWIWLNTDLQLEAHWKISCLQAYVEYKKYLSKESLQMGVRSLSSFTRVAQLEGWFSPFKKDYLR